MQTSASLPVIPSGEEGQIHVAWESIDQPGQFKFSAFFACNDPLQETFTIDFKGRNRAKILMPETGVNSDHRFGNVWAVLSHHQ